MIGYCGLDCQKCGAFIATQKNDDALRAQVAEEWARLYNAPIKPEHINCTGCKAPGVKTYYCDQLCEIRKCARPKSIATCAACADYPCPRLDELHKAAPEAKTNLDALRKK
ncbi:MAG: DUF3795 domain-containing protein [Phycisphaerae bacterium]|nr:DUF3795 domain-containing protein [Phycisphaerae bacterium]